jgi:hypothetical protein
VDLSPENIAILINQTGAGCNALAMLRNYTLLSRKVGGLL